MPASKRKKTKPAEWLDWTGCYDDGWRGLIVDAAFAHPAKAARGLVRRIFAHMEAQGWLPPRSRVLDVFGGIGTTGIEGASRGHEVVMVELEERFYKLALENFSLHRLTWEKMGDPLPVMIHGDSRKAVELVRGHFAGCVGSPPFDSQMNQGGDTKAARGLNADGTPRRGSPSKAESAGTLAVNGFGASDGQLGSMPAGNLDAAIASPPYAETVIDPQSNFQSAKCPNSKPARDVRGDGYDGVIGSPPYAASIKGEHGEVETADESHKARSDPKSGGSLGKSQRHGGYGGKDNLGNLTEGDVDAVVDSVVSSPPWENQEPSHAQGSKFETVHREIHPTKLAKDRPGMFQHEYGKTDGQVGNQTGETFWLAARTILEQVYALLRLGGHAAWIVKDYVKAGKRVPFCDNWARLCEAVGFKVVQRVRCHLVKTESNPGLFGQVTKKTERKSFFRRLHERKLPADSDCRIDFEEVVFVQKSSLTSSPAPARTTHPAELRPATGGSS